MLVIGIDTGGTFTDFTIIGGIDPRKGQLFSTTKTLAAFAG